MEHTHTIASIAAAVAILALLWQIYQSNRQSKMQSFLTYTGRYQDILTNLPVSIESEEFEPIEGIEEKEEFLRWIRAYFDLCSEEYFLNEEGLLDKKVWKLWEGGIKNCLKKPAYKWAWQEIQRDNYYNGAFADFINGIKNVDNKKQAESGRREILTPAPHTTGHTGP